MTGIRHDVAQAVAANSVERTSKRFRLFIKCSMPVNDINTRRHLIRSELIVVGGHCAQSA
jgi:hypothetical protein